MFSRFPCLSGSPGFQVYQVLQVSRFPCLSGSLCSPGLLMFSRFSRFTGFTMASRMNLKLEILKDPGDGFLYLWKVWFEERRIDVG